VRYFNREISWLKFNERVLEEALDKNNPLLERVKFLSIFHSNLDEFFMIRVSGLADQAISGVVTPGEDGLTPQKQLNIIRAEVLEHCETTGKLLCETFIPELAEQGIFLHNYSELTDEQKEQMQQYFEREVFPVLTPLAVDPGHPFPHISNLSLNLAVALRDPYGEEKFARLKIPNIFPRLVPLQSDQPTTYHFVWLEQVVAANLEMLFPGVEIIKSYPFRVIRDADLEIREDEAGDLLQSISKSLERRRFGDAINLMVDAEMPQRIQDLLMTNLELEPIDVYPMRGALGLANLMQLFDLNIPALKDPPFRPHFPPVLRNTSDIFRVVRQHDILLHHPFDSFMPVVDFIQQAASDPEVLAIKQTIYRVVEALARAASNGKQVSVLVELKARFDEENNIEWARALEKAGVHVVYGRIELKTHCKVALVVRREVDSIRRYVHLGTGNYNVKTANLYTDIGFFTSHPEIGADATILFNTLTGYSAQANYRKLLVSPGGIRAGIMARIEREIQQAQEGKPARIIFKVNALVDFATIDALYRASAAGVKVELIVRGSCGLVPGVKGLSENIRVISIVGRLLEHSRIYYFQNGEQEELYMGSADLMQRNLDRRVETLFPLEDAGLRQHVLESILEVYLRDTAKARELKADGEYVRVKPARGEKPFNSQDFLLECRAKDDGYSPPLPATLVPARRVPEGEIVGNH
jgi:polyphosphate kinase